VAGRDYLVAAPELIAIVDPGTEATQTIRARAEPDQRADAGGAHAGVRCSAVRADPSRL